jgi:hypothetical protein
MQDRLSGGVAEQVDPTNSNVDALCRASSTMATTSSAAPTRAGSVVGDPSEDADDATELLSPGGTITGTSAAGKKGAGAGAGAGQEAYTDTTEFDDLAVVPKQKGKHAVKASYALLCQSAKRTFLAAVNMKKRACDVVVSTLKLERLPHDPASVAQVMLDVSSQIANEVYHTHGFVASVRQLHDEKTNPTVSSLPAHRHYKDALAEHPLVQETAESLRVAKRKGGDKEVGGAAPALGKRDSSGAAVDRTQ